MINILNEAIKAIDNMLIKNQLITIKNYDISNVEGSPYYNLIDEINVSCNIQPFTPREIKKLTDSTIDTIFNYKFFILKNDANLLNSKLLRQSLIVWKEKEFRVFGIRDWRHNSSGWLCLYGGLK